MEYPALIGVSFAQAGLNLGTGYALVCALFWGLSTVAGRGVMTGMPLRLAASLRIVVGLVCMTFILLVYGKLQGPSLWPAAAQAHAGTAIVALLLLASISGGIPLLIYFEGLRLTRASTAGYFEMMQTLAAVCITWGFFHATLHPHQVVAAIVLMAAVVYGAEGAGCGGRHLEEKDEATRRFARRLPLRELFECSVVRDANRTQRLRKTLKESQVLRRGLPLPLARDGTLSE